MKSLDIRWTTALSAIILALNSYAGDEDNKKAILPPEPPAPSRWSLSAGATVSSIKATFQADPGLVGLLGSTAIYNGSGVLVYQNGTVGPGGAGTGFVSNYTGGSYNLANDTWTYTGATAAGSVSDTETSVGPYIRLAYDLDDFDSNTLHLSLFGQYSFTTAFNSGNNPLTDVNTIYTTEDVKFSPLIYNAALAGFGPGPFQTFGPGGYVASGLNIDMNTFELGVGLTKDLSDRVHLVFFTGPTLNLFETGLSSIVPGLPITPVRSDDSTTRFGWDGQLGLQIDLDSNKKWFIEALGNYHWVTPFTVSTPISSAKVQASSWSAELGLGLRF